jgi:hypothetical protein
MPKKGHTEEQIVGVFVIEHFAWSGRNLGEPLPKRFSFPSLEGQLKRATQKSGMAC